MASACFDTGVEGVDDGPRAVANGDGNVEVLEEGVRQDVKFEFHRVVKAVPIAVGGGHVPGVDRRRCGDSSRFEINGAGWVTRAATGVVTITDAAGQPHDDPHLVGEVPEAWHQRRGL